MTLLPLTRTVISPLFPVRPLGGLQRQPGLDKGISTEHRKEPFQARRCMQLQPVITVKF